ncbi:MAG: slipin family protein [Chloroflexi bacterium]|nr:slipin family protein [Chloroflexota bacterium]
MIGFAVFVFILLIIALSAIKVVQEYERGVVFRLGRFVGVRGPGLIILVPFIERMRKVDLRVVTLDVPTQEAITRDNVTVQVNAVVYFHVLDPDKAVINVEDYRRATAQIAQTTLRSVIGQHELDDILARRERINMELQRVIDDATEPWGIKVTVVEVKDVGLPASMQRAMAKQAEAERERRAKIIHAEGEYTASKQLARAADVMAASPGTLQLRYLSTLTEIAVEQNSTIVFPLPLELLRAFMPHMPEQAATTESTSSSEPEEQNPLD